jgi:DNA-binding CsgD family transcriptional regulator
MMPRDRLTAKEIQIADLVWQGLTNRDISKMIGTTEQVIKDHLRGTFDKLGVWSRIELACMSRATEERLGRRFGWSRLLPEPRRGELMLVSGTHLQLRPYAGDN